MEHSPADDPLARRPEALGESTIVGHEHHGAGEAIERHLELFDRLQRSGVPAAPIHSVPEVVQDAQVRHSGMLRPVPHEGRDGYWETLIPLRFDGERLPERSPPPERPTPDDIGFLTLDELLTGWLGRLRGTELVTLSACDTARGVTQGDSVMALPMSFLVAGAETVIASSR